ncbi:MAG: aminopeptidase P family protein, partial [Deltaproteobacteria bacterium]|nr:aminopeptidase P family protein [Deltaproteobacteria bacterium]
GFNQLPLYGHIMAGRNAALPSNSAGPTGGRGLGPFLSQSAGTDKIQKNEPIIVDYVASVEAYNSDQTRIFALGKLKDELVKAHEAMRTIQNTLAEKGQPGVVTGDLYQLALDMAQSAGLAENFMGYPVPVPFIGHGVGLELNEWPVIGRNMRVPLEVGMTIALEPKVVFPDKGVVGIENTFVVTPTGMERLNRFPDDIIVC